MKYSVIVQENAETGEAYIELPNEIVKEFGWTEYTILEFVENTDGTFTIREKEEVYGYSFYS